MKNPDEIKQSVKDKYAAISRNQDAAGCCGPTDCCGADGSVDYTIFSDDYSALKGYSPDADLGLGCGLATEFAKIKAGDTVVDLGSGAGNDAFVARSETGAEGRVIGVDMTEAMIQKSTLNAIRLGYENVDFVLGDIENIPLEESIADVVVSNCVMNLVPDKVKAFSETYRILKPGGHFSISDVVISGDLPDSVKEDAEMYAGCVAGAIDKDAYLEIIRGAGFVNLSIQKIKEIQLPDKLLRNYMNEDELRAFRKSDSGIYSITVLAGKPQTRV
ncbi:MAG: arsenite methyltransferase [Balneolia bacterium]|nr:arsenite methyltransferase [Balneolia bacterium]